jgi:hypothetical protein
MYIYIYIYMYVYIGINLSPFSANTSIDSRNGLDNNDNDDIDFYILARSKTTEILRQRKLKKQRLHLAAEKFNDKPMKADWIHFALGIYIYVYVCVYTYINIYNYVYSYIYIYMYVYSLS